MSEPYPEWARGPWKVRHVPINHIFQILTKDNNRLVCDTPFEKIAKSIVGEHNEHTPG
jgi:hypothetical protein